MREEMKKILSLLVIIALVLTLMPETKEGVTVSAAESEFDIGLVNFDLRKLRVAQLEL